MTKRRILLGGVMLVEFWRNCQKASTALFEEMFETMPDYLIDGTEHLWINEFIDNMDNWPAEKNANIVVCCVTSLVTS
jgi:hypothetical protein